MVYITPFILVCQFQMLSSVNLLRLCCFFALLPPVSVVVMHSVTSVCLPVCLPVCLFGLYLLKPRNFLFDTWLHLENKKLKWSNTRLSALDLELIQFLGSLHHKPGGRLPLLSTRPAVTWEYLGQICMSRSSGQGQSQSHRSKEWYIWT